MLWVCYSLLLDIFSYFFTGFGLVLYFICAPFVIWQYHSHCWHTGFLVVVEKLNYIVIFCLSMFQIFTSLVDWFSAADIILWRNKQISAGILVGVTVIWLLFEWIGYHLLTFVCHALILSLGILFCWSNISCAINK